MSYNPDIHHRRSIRLPGYDYTLAGAYFVTLITQGRECLLGSIANDAVALSPSGEIVAACWQRLPGFFPVRLDARVVMPNHFHGIVVLEPSGGGEGMGRGMGKGEAFARYNSEISVYPAANASPLRAHPEPARAIQQVDAPQPPDGTAPGSLAAILQNFKSVSTRRVNLAQRASGVRVWQRNYYEHIIRDQEEWERIRQYIQENPRLWEEDSEYVRW